MTRRRLDEEDDDDEMLPVRGMDPQKFAPGDPAITVAGSDATQEQLAADRFLYETAADHDGWIPVQTLLSFPRMRKLCHPQALAVAHVMPSDAYVWIDVFGVNQHAESPQQKADLERQLAARSNG